MRWSVLVISLCLFIGVMLPCAAMETMEDDETDEEIVICPACGAENPADAEVCSVCGEELPEPLPNDGEPYSVGSALLGNLFIPGLGYLFIDEPGWAGAEFGISLAGLTLVFIAGPQCDIGTALLGLSMMGGSWLFGVIHAPILTGIKNERLGYTLDLKLEPGLYLAEEGELRPGLRLCFSF